MVLALVAAAGACFAARRTRKEKAVSTSSAWTCSIVDKFKRESLDFVKDDTHIFIIWDVILTDAKAMLSKMAGGVSKPLPKAFLLVARFGKLERELKSDVGLGEETSTTSGPLFSCGMPLLCTIVLRRLSAGIVASDNEGIRNGSALHWQSNRICPTPCYKYTIVFSGRLCLPLKVYKGHESFGLAWLSLATVGGCLSSCNAARA